MSEGNRAEESNLLSIRSFSNILSTRNNSAGHDSYFLSFMSNMQTSFLTNEDIPAKLFKNDIKKNFISSLASVYVHKNSEIKGHLEIIEDMKIHKFVSQISKDEKLEETKKDRSEFKVINQLSLISEINSEVEIDSYVPND